MFKLLAQNSNKRSKPFLVNDYPDHPFTDLASMPETQLVMLVDAQLWQRLPEHIQTHEALGLAGPLGARPGNFEWEWVESPPAIRWWRRASSGQESLFGMALGVERGDLVELYGLVEVDDQSPHWAEVIPEETANAMPEQARIVNRRTGRAEALVLADLYRDYFRGRGMLTLDPARPGESALRRGTIREVERFRDAVRGLLERASQAG